MRGPSAFLLLAAALLASGCAGHRPLVRMNQETVDRLGRRELPGSAGAAYQATLLALRRLGYHVVSSDPGQGRIHTSRQLARIDDPGTYAGRVWGTTPLIGAGAKRAPRLDREYWLTVQELAPGRAVVIANPYLSDNGQDVSSEEIWDLDVEARAWDRLFDAIRFELRRIPPASWAPSASPRSQGAIPATPLPPQDDSLPPPSPPGNDFAPFPAPGDAPPPPPLESPPPAPPNPAPPPTSRGSNPSADPASEFANPFDRTH